MTTARTPRERKPKRPDVEVPALGFVGMLRWAWRQLTSMRTALALLLLLAVAAIPGSLIPQRSSDPNGVIQCDKTNPGWMWAVDLLQLAGKYMFGGGAPKPADDADSATDTQETPTESTP